MCCWDYHVILIHHHMDAVAFVYDLDTALPFPCDFDTYFDNALLDNRLLSSEEYYRSYRVIGARHFLDTFASDRSHMRRPDGTWSMPAPAYDPISTAECTNNLDAFISMEADGDQRYGAVLDGDSFRQRFSAAR